MSSPTFTAVDISSNNSIKTNYAGADDIVSINITASDTINQPYVVFQSGGAAITNTPSYSGSGSQWTTFFTVSSSDTNGAISFTIDASNANGSVQTTSTTNSTSVTKVGTSSLTTTVTTTSGDQIGSDIDGEASSGYYFGYSVSLSSDGTIVAIGGNHNAGHVRVYQRDTNEAIGWKQLGGDIDGEANGDGAGYSVSLNSDTSSNIIVAIGAPYNDAGDSSNTMRGHVRVYQYDASKTTAVTDQSSNTFGPIGWNRLGDDIDGDAGDRSGNSVSLSSDGTIVAIGAWWNDTGRVRVYQYSNSSWSQVDSDIEGQFLNSGDKFGHSVSLSSDGTIVAIGATENDGSAYNAGCVQVYQYSNSSWSQIGSTITGKPVVEEQSGYSLSLSSDGTILAIGSPYNDQNATDSGYVRVYQYNSGSWSQMGGDIEGEALSDYSGWSVSLSSDGTIVAIGAYGNNGTASDAGHVRVYQYDASKTSADTNPSSATFGPVEWNRLGSDIDGEAENDKSGWSVSLSSDGSIVAIGGYGNNGSIGHVRIFETGATGTVTTTFNMVPPDLTALTIASNNTDTTLAKASDNVTLSLTYDMSINTPIIDISSGGAAVADTTITYATVNDSSLNWTATYTVDNADTDGTVTFAIDASSIQTATSATQITQSDITSGSNVTIDNTVPTFSSTVLSSDNSNVTITFSESVYNATGGSGDIEISDFTVSITGGTATSPSFTAITKNSQSVYDLSLSFSNTADGSETLTINPASATSIYDAASNAASTSQSNNTATINDKLTPSFTLVDLSSNNSIKTNYAGASDVISLNLTASESINQPYVVFQSGGAAITNSPSYSGSATQWTVSYTVSSSDTNGAVSFTIDASDNAGNTSQRTTTTNSTSVTKVGTSSLTTTVTNTSGDQIGSDIDGESAGDQSGYSVSLSSDGTIVAIGANLNDGDSGSTSDNRGHVRVYQYSNSSWSQLGSDIDGEAASDQSGRSISLSSDGTIVAIGAVFNDGNGSQKGHVRVYQYSSSDVSWNQLGSDIDGEDDSDKFGTSVSLNSDGTILAIGAHYNSGNGSSSGHVRVYEYSSSSWSKLGSDIDGETAGDQSGWSVSLSSDGTIVAIGATRNDGNGSDSGCVRVYQYSNSSWSKLGSDIVGESANDRFGESVSMSSDGTILAIGAPYNSSNRGHVRVYQRDTNEAIGWKQLGSDIDGEAANNYLGRVSLSSDGTILAIGARYASNNGSVSIYQYSSGSWSKLGSDIVGEAEGDASGYSVSLSSNGTIVAIGGYYNDGNGDNSGHVRIFETGATTTVTTTVNAVPPDLTALTIASNNADTTLAKASDNVTLSLTYDISINTPIIDISSGGAAVADTTITYATVNGSNLNWTATYTVDSADTDGTVTFAIDASSIQTATSATEMTQSDITSGSNVTIDTTAPTFTLVDLSSNHNTSTLAKEGDIITLNVTASETISTPTIVMSIGGSAVSNSAVSGSGTTYTTTYTVGSSDNGSVTFTIDASDNAGNNATQVTATTNSSAVTADTTAPTFSSTALSSDNSNVTITFSENVYNTATYSSSILTYTVTANGSSNYILNGSGLTDSAQPALNLHVGQTVTFSVASSVNSSHPFKIGTSSNGGEITTSDSRLSSSGSDPILINFTPDANGTFYYYCSSHNGMGNSIAVVGDIEISDFTVSLSGGTATSPSFTAITKNSQSVYDLSLSFSNIADGGETLTIVPASTTSIYDATGNASSTTQSNNTASVNDKTAPAFNSVDLSSNNATSTFAKTSDIVSLTISMSESINQPYVVFQSGGNAITNAPSYTGSGSDWTVTYTVSGSDTDGSISFTIDASDNAGNVKQRTTTTNSSAVTTDNTAPTLTVVDLSSNNTTSTLAKENDVITLNITASETINTPIIAVSVGGSPVSNSAVSGSGSTYTTTYTIGSSDNGSVTFTIDASDNAGNSANQVTATTNGSAITVDTTVPTLTLVDLSSNNTTSTLAKENDVITLNITASETINTPIVAVSVGGSPVSNSAVSGSGSTYTTTYTIGSSDSGSVTFTIDASDNAGNSANQVTATTNGSAITVDTTAPTFSSTVLSSDNSNVTITFSESVYNATGGSGDIEISDFTVSISGGTATSPSFSAITKNSQSVYDLSLSFSNTADGSETLTIVPASATSIYDAAGNAASTSQSNNTASINDKLTPSFSSVDLSSNNSIKTKYAGASDVISLNLTASESINQPYVVFQSGGAAITNSPSYSGSGTQWTVSYTVSSSDTDGAVSFTIDASDNAGNTSQRTTTTNSTTVTKVGSTTVTAYTNTQEIIGSIIEGETAGDYSGQRVSLSSDGTIVALGSYYHNSNAGHIRVYQYSSSDVSWNQLGSDIDGEADDKSGSSISLSDDGTILAIGGTGPNSNTGHVRVYEYSSSDVSWNQLGADIDGEAEGDRFGSPLSLSSDGTILAITSTRVNNNTGHVRVYKYSSSDVSWNQLGSDIDGETESDYFGNSLSLSTDGTTVAIGSHYNDGPNGTDSNIGLVRVYQYSSSDVSWNQLGSDIYGEEPNSNDQSGYSISLNSDGTILGVVARGNAVNGYSGLLRVYQYSNSSWSQLGSDIDADAVLNTFGPSSVSLSDDGTILAFGSPTNNSYAGHVRIYQYSSSDVSWNQIGADIDGEVGGERSGYSVSLTNDGTIVAIGVERHGTNFGGVRVYGTGVPRLATSTVNKVPPELTALTIASNNADTTQAKDSDNVTISLTYDMSINTPIIDISSGGAAIADTTITYATVNDSSLNWTAVYTVDSADTDGTVTFAIDASSIQTTASATQVTQSDITNSSSVNIDTTVPTFSSTVLSSDNSNVTITFSENVYNAAGGSGDLETSDFTVSIANGSATSPSFTAISKVSQTVYDLSLSITGTADGAETLTINPASSAIFDQAANAASTSQSNNTATMNDKLSPSFTTVDLSSNNSIKTNYAGADDVISLNLTASESINQPYVVFQSGGAAITNSPSYSGSATQWTVSYTVSSSDTNGAVSFTIDASDNIGNTSQRTTTTNSSGVTKVGTSSLTTVTSSSTGTTGLQIGAADIVGTGLYDAFGRSVSLSSDGTIVAVGAPYNHDTGAFNGKVSVYQYNSSDNSWNQLGSYIYGETPTNASYAGSSVSLSSDGTILAIGEYGHDFGSTGTNEGRVRVYEYSSSNVSWNQLGSQIDGDIAQEHFGRSVSLSSNGTILAIGTENSNTYTGDVRVYEYSSTDVSWNQLGSQIDGEAENDRSGISVSLSSDGTIVAIGAYANDETADNAGHVRVYQYSSTDVSWNQLGEDIDGEAESDISGYSISLSGDGTIVAIGAYRNDGNGNNSGHVRVYQYDASKNYLDTDQSSNTFGPIGWNRLGGDIDGEAENDNSGISVSLNSDGTILAIGASGNDGTATGAGHVRLYQYYNSVWNKVGDDIDGEAQNNYFGASVSLNSDGTIVAIGATGSYGYTRICETGVLEFTSNTVTADAIPPDLTALSIASNNSNPIVAANNDEITISFSYDLSINTPVIDISSGGVAINDTTITYATVNDSSLNWTAKYTVDNSDNGGVVTFAIDASSVQTFTNATQATQSDITDGTSMNVDKTAPTFTTIDISSNNNIKTSFAGANDTVSLNITASESINQPYIVFQSGNSSISNAITYSGSTNQWNASFDISSADTNGAISFTIDASDNNGNNATQVTETTNSTSVTKVGTSSNGAIAVPPELTALTISTNNSNTALGIPNDEVTLSFAYDASINTPVVDISSGGVAIADTTITYATVNDSSLSWTAIYTVNSSDTDGTVTFGIDASSVLTATDATQATQANITSGSNVTIDTTSPTFTTVDISSNNPIDASFAKVSNTVTLNMVASEIITTPTIVLNIGGSSVSHNGVTGSGNSYSITYTVQSGDNGAFGFTIDASDNAGNNAVQATSTTNSTSVTADTVDPSFNAVTIASNNNNTSLAKESETITISMTADENILTPTVSLAIGGVSKTHNGVTGSGSSYSATYTVQSGDSGLVSFTVDASDNAGNTGLQVASTTNASSVTVDTTLPTFSTVDISSNNATSTLAKHGDVVTLNLTASETVNQPYVVFKSGGASTSNSPTYSGSGTQWAAAYTVNTADTDGSVTFTIDASDNAGNNAIQVTSPTSGSVTVDTTTITFTTVDISSNNQVDASFAKASDVVTLNLVASENINTPTIALDISGSAVTHSGVTGSGTTYSTTYTVQSGDNGVFGFTVDASDIAGNNAVQVTSTTNSTSVTADNVDPSFSAVTVASNNNNTALAKESDVITLSLTANEDIQTPTVILSVGGSSKTHSGVSGSGSSYSTTYTVQSGDSGVVSFTVDASDNAGNTGLQVTETTNSSSVTVDTDVPTIPTVDLSTNHANTALAKVGNVISLNLIANQDIHTPSIALVIGSTSVTHSGVTGSGSSYGTTYTVQSGQDGAVTFTIDASDNAGNTVQRTTTSNGTSVTVDTTNPSFSTVDISSNNATSSSYAKTGDVITLNLVAEESINTPMITLDVSGTTVSHTGVVGSGTTYSTTYSVTSSEHGPVTFTIDASDNAGNTSQRTTTTNSSSMTVDNIDPSFDQVYFYSPNDNSSYAKANDLINITYRLTEDISSHTGNMYIGGSQVTPSFIGPYGGLYLAEYRIQSGDTGAITFSLTVTDNAGNVSLAATETTNSSSITVDTTDPSLSFVDISSNNVNTSFAKEGDVITLNFTTSESVLTPNIAFTLGGSAVSHSGITSSGNDYASTYTVPASVDGAFAFTIDISDNPGNTIQRTTTTTGNTMTVDTTNPTLNTVTMSSSNTIKSIFVGESESVNLAITASESIQQPYVVFQSGGASIANNVTYSGSGSQWTASYDVSSSDTNGAISFTVDVSDNAGNNAATTTTSTTDSTAVTKLSSNSGLITTTFSQSVRGSTILGTTSSQAFGNSVSLNSDGTVVAIGAYLNDDAGNNSGAALIYQYSSSSNSWSQLGSQLNPVSGSNDNFGDSISVNSDTSTNIIVAISAPRDDDNGSDSGSIFIYQYNSSSTSWDLLGSQLNGPSGSRYGFNNGGKGVSLNGDGSILAVGGYQYNSSAGIVDVYEYSTPGSTGGTWNQIGSSLTGSSGDRYGRSVGLNYDGTKLVFGASATDVNQSNSGSVYVYEYSSNAWSKVGTEINGTITDGYLGESVSINNDGTIIAISSINANSNTGYTEIYEYSGGSWSILGSTIEGMTSNEYSGYSLSLNGDGTIVAIGARGYSTDKGATRIYQYSSSDTSWNLVGSQIVGSNNYDYSSWSVAISNDGKYVSIGTPIINSDTGLVNIYGSGITVSEQGIVTAIPPLLTDLSIISNNSVNTSLAIPNDDVTIAVTYDISINTPMIDISSGSVSVTDTTITYAQVNGSNTNWTISYTVDTSDTDGLVTFAIDASSGQTLESAVQVTQADITNSSSVTIDTTAPILTNVTAITTPTNDTTPSYIFNSTETGTISSTLSFTTTTSAVVGSNTITFDTLAEGTYSGYTITITDTPGNVSSTLTIPDFVIDTTSPTITGIAIDSSNTNVTVTFSEAVYNTANGTGDLETSDFTQSLSGGLATLPSISNITKTSQSVWDMSLAYSGYANGSETFTIRPTDATSIYDEAGNAASTSQSNNTISLNNNTAIFLSLGMTGAIYENNSNIKITFSESVFNTDGGSGDLETSDFTATLSGGVATNPIIGNISKVSDSVYDLSLTFTGDADGTEILTIKPSSNSAIYDVAGAAMSTIDDTSTNLMITWINTQSANYLDSTYVDGFVDISGGNLILKNSEDVLNIAGDVSLNGNVYIGGKLGYGVENITYELDVSSGNVDISGGFTITGDASINGNVVTAGNVYITGSDHGLSISNSSIDYSDSVDLSINQTIQVLTNDNSFNVAPTIHNDLSSNGNFGASFAYDASLSVAGNVMIVDASNTNYGSYTVYSGIDATNAFVLGKSKSNVFNIVNSDNAGVYMNTGSNSFSSASDINLKKNIQPLQSSSDKLKQLEPRTFNWKSEDDNADKHIGFIAQEVEKIYPELVEENTYPNGSTYKGVNTTRLIPYLIKEIQDLKNELDSMK